MTGREEWELIIEIGEDSPDLAWVHSSWERWSDEAAGLPSFRRLSDRDGLLIGTVPAGEIVIEAEIEEGWETEMFAAERAALSEPTVDLEPQVLPEERTTVFRVGGERPFWIEIETESSGWSEILAGNPWAVQISSSPRGPRQRWLLPHCLLRLGSGDRSSKE